MHHPRDTHGHPGRLEKQHSPYHGFGQPDVLGTGIAELAAKAACAAAGGKWDDVAKQCMSAVVPQPGVPTPQPIPIDPAAQICATVGGFWDPVTKTCSTAPPPPPKEDNTKTWLIVGAIAIGAIYFLSKKRK